MQFGLLAAFVLVGVQSQSCSESDLDVATIARALTRKKYVDLTHAFHPGKGEWETLGEIPHFSAFPTSTREVTHATHPSVYPFKAGTKGGGFFAEWFCHMGQWGTHVDPPIHFVPNGRKLHQLRPDEMVLPLVVIDISDKAKIDPDTELTLADIEAFEAAHGRIQAGSFVALRTDIHKLWETGALHHEKEGGSRHFPNWGLPALKFLYEERGVKATGHEQTDTDSGICASTGKRENCRDWELRQQTVDGILATSANLTSPDLGGDWVYGFANEFYVLSRDTYQIELMANLNQLPPVGAMIVASWPKPLDASGFPARVFAVMDA